jgi:formate dehydrogenase iron-sulfur subunit
MKINRRDFIKGSAGAAGLMLLSPQSAAMAGESQTKAGKAMLIDITKCVGCWWCYAACKEYNNLPQTDKPELKDPPLLSPDVWTTLDTEEKAGGWVSRKKACNHCTEAACVEVCPTGALSYNHLGYVQYDREKCSGCGYCAEYCPFDVPQMETDKFGVAIMNKCTFCHDRVSNGEQPACAAACTTGAITFGERQDLIAEAQDRVAELQKSNSQAAVYGIDELQGLHVMYVLDDAPEIYNLPPDPQVPVTTKVRDIFKWLGSGLAIAALAGFGFNYLVTRLRMRSRAK